MEAKYALLRPSLPGDEPELKALWQAVFGDTGELIDSFFELIYTPGDAAVAVRDGRIVSAGYCLPGPVAAGLRCAYVYAMATCPEHRGHGLGGDIAGLLARRAFEKGADVVATLPAGESLCGWYARILGMEPFFKKGGPGVDFPESWQRFAALCGPHDPDTPDRLHAVARPGADISAARGLGWDCTWD